jgi:hypothetical protein
MAVLASARERIVTKAVPRLIPVSASRETCMLSKTEVSIKAHLKVLVRVAIQNKRFNDII